MAAREARTPDEAFLADVHDELCTVLTTLSNCLALARHREDLSPTGVLPLLADATESLDRLLDLAHAIRAHDREGRGEPSTDAVTTPHSP